MIGGDLAGLGEISIGRHDTPPSPIIGSRNTAAVSESTASLQRHRIAVRHMHHTGGHRLERRPLGRLAGQRESAHGAAVEEPRRRR